MGTMARRLWSIIRDGTLRDGFSRLVLRCDGLVNRTYANGLSIDGLCSVKNFGPVSVM
jgi:hypothetical protein